MCYTVEKVLYPINSGAPMEHLNDLIQWYEENATRKEDSLIKIKLKMINSLFDEITSSEDRLFMEEIIAAFAEIVSTQRSVISDLEAEEEDCIYPDAYLFRNDPATRLIRFEAEEAPDEREAEKALHPYLPPAGGFQTDEQVRKAFANFLTYHTVKETKDGRQKRFSKYTVYDYCSRIKALWEAFSMEQREGTLAGRMPPFTGRVQPGSSFLNAYHHIPTLRQYIEVKGAEVKGLAAGSNQKGRAEAPAEGEKANPLNHPRNLGNTTAALAKFIEFKSRIEQDA